MAEFLYVHHPMGSANSNSGSTALLARPGLRAKGVHLGKLTGGRLRETGVAGFPVVGVGRHVELTAIADVDNKAKNEQVLLDSILQQLTRQNANFFRNSLQSATIILEAVTAEMRSCF